MNNKKNIIILVAILAVLLIVGGTCFGLVWINNSKNIIESSINNTMDVIGEEFEKAKEEVNNIEEKTVIANLNAKFNLDLSDNVLTTEKLKTLQTKLNKTNLNIDIKMNQTQKLIQMVLDLAVENNDLINIDAVIDDNKGYVKFKDVFDDYVQTELTEDTSYVYEGVDIYDDIDVIYKVVDPVIRKEIMKGQVEKTQEEIDVNGEKVKVNKHTLTLDTKLANQMGIAVLESVKANENAIESLVNISQAMGNSITKEELLEDINNEIENINTDLENLTEEENEMLYFSIYTKGIIPKVVQYSLLDKLNEGFTLKIKEDDKYSLNFVYEEKEMLTIEGTYKKEEVDLTYKMVVKDEYEFTGKLLFRSENTENKNETKEHVEFSINTGDDLIGNIGIILDCTTNITEESLSVDVSNSITEDEIPIDVMNKFQTKLLQILLAFGLTIEDIGMLGM